MSKMNGQVVYRGQNGYDVKVASDLATIPPDYGESLTVQSMAQDADLNVLMERYGITGKMPENARMPVYGDFTHITDYRSALEAVRSADESFLELPPAVRARFDNDPQRLLMAAADPAARPLLKELGLLKPEPPIAAPAAPPAAMPPAPTPPSPGG